MGRRYFGYGTQNVDSSTDSTWSLGSVNTIRPRIYEIIFGSEATPADNSIVWIVQRCTAQGTNTSWTPVALDNGDPAATATNGQNHTAEPTYTANGYLFYMPLNQRATHRWIADPMGPMVCPATNANGVGIQPVHASFTGLVSSMVYWEE